MWSFFVRTFVMQEKNITIIYNVATTKNNIDRLKVVLAYYECQKYHGVVRYTIETGERFLYNY